MRRKILFFDHTAKLGGGEIALLNLVKRLDGAEFSPVVVLASDGPFREKLAEAGIETHIVPLAVEVAETRKDTLGGGSILRLREAWVALAYCFKLAGFIRTSRADLVHTNSLKADILGGIASRLARVPVVWHVRDRIEADYLPKPVVVVFRRLCRLIPNFVIANSHSTLVTLRMGKNAGLVVHDGIPVSDAEPPKTKSTSPMIALVGRISAWKGQHIFIAAAAAVHRRFPLARFQIIGSAMFGEEEYEKKVRALCRELALENFVEFTGFRADVQQLIEAVDILVHASTSGEPFGQVVVEGMAARKPVVATNGGGVPEIMRDGETGILVPMGDAGAMADAMIRLLSDPGMAESMGAAGRRRVLAHFTAEHTARNMEAVFRQVFGTTVAPPRFAPAVP